jgi:hypothetical protein
MTEILREAIPQLERTVETLEELAAADTFVDVKCAAVIKQIQPLLITLKWKLQCKELKQLNSWKAEVTNA